MFFISKYYIYHKNMGKLVNLEIFLLFLLYIFNYNKCLLS